jgi:sulfur carrier protein ThiS
MGQNDLEITFDDGATVRTVVEKLGVPERVPRTVLVNRINAAMDQKLEDHDVVSVLQPLSGG